MPDPKRTGSAVSRDKRTRLLIAMNSVGRGFMASAKVSNIEAIRGADVVVHIDFVDDFSRCGDPPTLMVLIERDRRRETNKGLFKGALDTFLWRVSMLTNIEAAAAQAVWDQDMSPQEKEAVFGAFTVDLTWGGRTFMEPGAWDKKDMVRYVRDFTGFVRNLGAKREDVLRVIASSWKDQEVEEVLDQ